MPNKIKTRYYLIAWIYALLSKKPKRCEDCKFNQKIYIYEYCYTDDWEKCYVNYCLHNQRASQHNPVKMVNGKCKGYKRKNPQDAS